MVCAMRNALSRCGGDVTLAADVLGISEAMLGQELRFDELTATD
jgi:hypothetical protein